MNFFRPGGGGLNWVDFVNERIIFDSQVSGKTTMFFCDTARYKIKANCIMGYRDIDAKGMKASKKVTSCN